MPKLVLPPRPLPAASDLSTTCLLAAWPRYPWASATTTAVLAICPWLNGLQQAAPGGLWEGIEAGDCKEEGHWQTCLQLCLGGKHTALPQLLCLTGVLQTLREGPSPQVTAPSKWNEGVCWAPSSGPGPPHPCSDQILSRWPPRGF